MTPFITEDVRKKIKNNGFGESGAVGDLCFIVYSEMMRRWNESPRWTTIHFMKKEFVITPETSPFLTNLIKDLRTSLLIDQPYTGLTSSNASYKFDVDDVFSAADLALDVFMYFHGIPYELEKEEQNGTIL